MKILKSLIEGLAMGYLCGNLMIEIPWTKFIIIPIMFAFLWLSTEVMKQPKFFLSDENKAKYQAKWDKKPEFYKKIILKFEEFMES